MEGEKELARVCRRREVGVGGRESERDTHTDMHMQATAIRKCRRCGWCEPGSREEAEAWEQAKEHEKFRASRKRDEIGAVDETGGVEDESSVRAFRFQCRMMYQLDDDTPGWLEAVREKHYGGGQGQEQRHGRGGPGRTRHHGGGHGGGGEEQGRGAEKARAGSGDAVASEGVADH